MKSWWIVLIAAVVTMGCSQGDVDVSSTSKFSEEELTASQEMYDALSKEYDDANKNYGAAMRAAQAEKAPREELMKIRRELEPNAMDYAAKFIKIDEDFEGTPAGIDGLVWVISNLGTGGREIEVDGEKVDYGKTAYDRLFEKHKDSEEIASALPVLVRGMPKADTETTIKNLIASTKHNRVKGVGTMALFDFYKNIERYKGFLDNPRFKQSAGEETIEYLTNAEVPDLEPLLESIIEKYPDFDYGKPVGDRPVDKVGERADNKLFAMRNLLVGKVAPNINGVDLDGREFNLEDYRGKVVMLDFWGDW